jgi:3-deoxy-7-phosphoheptulonate synthase
MIVVFRSGVSESDIQRVIERVESRGLRTHLSRGVTRTIVGCIGDERVLVEAGLKAMPGVEDVIPVQRPYKLASREFLPERSIVGVAGVAFGGRDAVVVAGPCSVEDLGTLLEIAAGVREAGAAVLRGGAFKPRTSPYSFRGLGEEALEMLGEARRRTGLPVVTEVMDPRQVERVAQIADMLQIGARNMQNFDLLGEAGQSRMPVLLKRGMSAQIKELLLAAEYVLSTGNMRVVLCERGIRTFETLTRNTLDISAVPVLRKESHLPVIVDPSHAAGRSDIVADLAVAAVAAGADGIMVEVHPRPEQARSDGDQALTLRDFDGLMGRVAAVAAAVGRGTGDRTAAAESRTSGGR